MEKSTIDFFQNYDITFKPLYYQNLLHEVTIFFTKKKNIVVFV